MTPDSPRLRLSILGIVTVSLFAALFARLWYLQVMTAPDYKVAAEANRVRTVAVQAPRGRILDRNGKVIVDNRISVVVTLDRTELRELDEDEQTDVLKRLAAELTRAGQPTKVKDLRERIEDKRFSPYTPVPVALDVQEELKIFLDEHTEDFPSIAVERVAVRHYPYGQIAAHVLGYVGEINDTELEERADEAEKPYQLGDDIGKAGVERVFEADLRGRPGLRQIEVDADGDPVRTIADTPPVAGDDVVLTIDIDLQAYTEAALKRGLEQARQRRMSGGHYPKAPTGSAVVLDPRNGELLALASFPTYNPADFVNGISSATWRHLNDPANHYPLNNWAIQGQYAPGSTFKLFTGFAAMRKGVRAPNSTINDPGFYKIPNCDGGTCIKRNAGSRRYGLVDMRRAITVSSDVYFYDIGAQFWIQRSALGGKEALQEQAKQFGLNEKTGVALPGEQPGRIPTPDERKEFCKKVRCLDSGWYTGDNVNMAIGQGDVVVTPLQLANGYAAFANGGSVHVPSIATKVLVGGTERVRRELPNRVTRKVEIPTEIYQALLDGLIGVTRGAGGTATGVFSGFPHDTFPVAAKTGTAQVNNKDDTAVFVAFGPASSPQYVMSVFLEEAGFGGVAAAPVARTVFDVFAGLRELPAAPKGGVYKSSIDEIAPNTPSGGNVLD